MNFDLDTKEGMANAVLWTQNIVDTIKDGGSWIVPRSGTVVFVNKTNRVATIYSLIPDTAIPRVFKAMGWEVIEK